MYEAPARWSSRCNDRALQPVSSATSAEDIKSSLTLVDAYLAATVGDEIAALDGTPTASLFKDFMNTHGHRPRGFFDYSEASWFEEPTPVVDRLRSVLLNDDLEPGIRRRQLIEQRDRNTDEIRAEIAAYPLFSGHGKSTSLFLR